MKYRLSKIYTRQGDNGTTALGDGTRVDKNHLRVETYGTIDELNSSIGVLLNYSRVKKINTQLTKIQHTLFELGSELCIPDRIVITSEHIDVLENNIDDLNSNLTPLKEFILPGGTKAASMGHLVRTICRRAERHLVALSKSEEINLQSLRYLNRLSDLFFVIARYLNFSANVKDEYWQNPHAD